MLQFISLLALLLSYAVDLNASDVEESACAHKQCSIIVDAGSTGSRVHIYAYDLDDKNNPIEITEIWSNKVKPGLASIEPDEASINQYLTKLFANLPENNLPVTIYATAGMRLLSAPQQDSIYSSIKKWFNEQSSLQLKEARTISGKEEAVFAWLSVNYGINTLQSAKSDLVGIMDFGGASTQIAFPLADNAKVDPSETEEIKIYNRSVQLYAHSTLGLGLTIFSQQYLTQPACFPTGYSLPDGRLASGDALTCQKNTSILVNSLHRVNQRVKPTLADSQVKSWYALGSLASIAGSPPYHFEKNQLNMQEFLGLADKEFCHKDWNSLLQAYPGNDYIYVNCFSPSAIYSIIVDGYGINPTATIHYPPSKGFQDWTLGVILHGQ